MIAYIQKYLASIPPVFIDGLLYALIALFTFCQAYFGGDEAAKFITPATKFWLNAVIGGGATVFAAIKMFRNSTFAQHQDEQKKAKSGDTQFIPKP